MNNFLFMTQEEIKTEAKLVAERIYPDQTKWYVSPEEAEWVQGNRIKVAMGFELGANWMEEKLKNI